MERNLLWSRFKEGDSTAFETIYSSYVDDLLIYGSRFTKDSTLVEDSIHDLFVRIYERREHLNTPQSIKAYLYSSLRREILHRADRREMPQDEIQESHFELDIDVEQAIIRSELNKEQLSLIQETLAVLSDRQREVIYLSFYNNLSHDEIAQVLGINNQSVRNLLSQGLKRMREGTELPVAVIVLLLPKLF